MYDPSARVALLDEQGIQAQVLYPNVGGFGNGYFTKLGDPELVLACVQAYNDFLTDWCSVAPDRLVAITALPFWDVELAVAELHRCVANGHRAVNFCNQPAGLRPAAVRAPALGPDLGRRAGGRRVGELPRRRRVDGHPVRRRRRRWDG